MENSSASTTLHGSPIDFPPKAFRWYASVPFILGAAILFLLVVLVGMAAWMATHQLDAVAAARAMTSMPGVVIQSVAEVFVIAYIVVLLPPVAQTSLAGLGFRKITGAQISIVVAGAVLMFVVVTPLATILQSLLHFKQPESAIAVFAHTSGWKRAVFIFFGVVLAPAFEESVFRLVLFNAMRHWWGLWPGAIVSSVLFGLAHLQPPYTPAMFASITFPLMVGGLILCWVYAKTNNAWASFLTHGGFNAFTLALLLLFPQLAK